LPIRAGRCSGASRSRRAILDLRGCGDGGVFWGRGGRSADRLRLSGRRHDMYREPANYAHVVLPEFRASRVSGRVGLRVSRRVARVEEERRFVPIEHAASRPIVFLQSLNRPRCVSSRCRCWWSSGISSWPFRRRICGRSSWRRSGSRRLGGVLCLAVLSVAEGKMPTANLLAPVVVNLKTRRACRRSRWIRLIAPASGAGSREVGQGWGIHRGKTAGATRDRRRWAVRRRMRIHRRQDRRRYPRPPALLVGRILRLGRVES